MARLKALILSLTTITGLLLLTACGQNIDDKLVTEHSNTDTLSNAQNNINPSFLLAGGKKADPNYIVTLPKDHQSHPEFDIEWWYLTANLIDEAQNPYAFQWTLFRFSNRNQNNPWHNGQMFMAHTSLHTPTAHWFEEKFAAGGVGNAIVDYLPSTAGNKPTQTSKNLSLKMDDWLWQAHNSDGSLFPARLNTTVNKQASSIDGSAKENLTMAITFELIPSGPFILQGANGYSMKSGQGKHASHYYSLPFIDIVGSVEGPQGKINLTGKAWYDHEWTSTLLDASTAGWDWMSLHLDNGDKLMAFSMRLNDNENYQTGTYISANGEAQTLLPHQITLNIEQKTAVDGRSLPLHWQVLIPDRSLDIRVQATNERAYNPSIFGYYEGPVVVSGTHGGEGFLELTGY